MKRKIFGIFILTLLSISTFSQVLACTTFTTSDGDKLFVGANFDWSHNFNIFMHFFPAEDDKFGRVIFELWYPLEMDYYPHNPDWIAPRQGMNDQGLFCAQHVAPYLLPVNSSDKPLFYSQDPDDYEISIYAHCLATCYTVVEVIDVYNQYNLVVMANFQCFFADRNGASVIIEGHDIIYKEGDYQVLTNFYHSNPELGGSWGFDRYDTAVSMLEDMTDLSVDYFTDICDSTHVSTTVHTNIYDLMQEKIWIYYMNDFERVIEIDLNEELSKGESRFYLGSYFEPVGNQEPGKPEAPTGNETGSPGEIYEYSLRKIKDPDGDRLSYMWDWGDGTSSQWIQAPKTGVYLSAEHNWTEEGTYEVRVKAMDMYGAEGEWSDPLVVSMPKNKIFNDFNPLIFRLIKQFPIFKFLL